MKKHRVLLFFRTLYYWSGWLIIVGGILISFLYSLNIAVEYGEAAPFPGPEMELTTDFNPDMLIVGVIAFLFIGGFFIITAEIVSIALRVEAHIERLRMLVERQEIKAVIKTKHGTQGSMS